MQSRAGSEGPAANHPRGLSQITLGPLWTSIRRQQLRSGSSYGATTTILSPPALALSTVWARAMTALGHEVSVVAAHPHYPESRWGRRLRPYRERRARIPVIRLPLWSGRATTLARLRQSLDAATLTAAVPYLGTPEILVVVSPSFPGLVPAMLNSRLRRVPWVLWLQDILPDGAAATGVLPALDHSFARLAKLNAAHTSRPAASWRS